MDGGGWVGGGGVEGAVNGTGECKCVYALLEGGSAHGAAALCID